MNESNSPRMKQWVMTEFECVRELWGVSLWMMVPWIFFPQFVRVVSPYPPLSNMTHLFWPQLSEPRMASSPKGTNQNIFPRKSWDQDALCPCCLYCDLLMSPVELSRPHQRDKEEKDGLPWGRRNTHTHTQIERERLLEKEKSLDSWDASSSWT